MISRPVSALPNGTVMLVLLRRGQARTDRRVDVSTVTADRAPGGAKCRVSVEKVSPRIWGELGECGLGQVAMRFRLLGWGQLVEGVECFSGAVVLHPKP